MDYFQQMQKCQKVKKLIEVVSGSPNEDFNEFLGSSHQLAHEKSIVGVAKNVGHIV